MLGYNDILNDVIDYCISNAKKKGATDVEVGIVKSISETVSFRNKKLEESNRSENIGLSLTAYINKKKTSVSSSNLKNDNLEKLIERCVEAAKITPEDENNSLPEEKLFFKNSDELDLFDKTHLENNQKIEFLKEAEEVAFKNKEIVNTNGSSFSESKKEIILGNSRGFKNGYKSSNFVAYCEVVSKNNGSMERDYEYTSKRHFEDLMKPSELGSNAAKFAIRKLKPRKINSGKFDVIFDKRISKNFLNYFSSAITGSSIYKGTSFLREKLNKKIFLEDINIVDRADINRGNGSKYFDNEGVKIDNLTLVNNGVLNDYLMDTYYGKKLKMTSNGRSGGTTNLYFENGKQNLKDLMKSNKKIFYVTETIGHGTNIVTGDYSVGAGGIMIENGEFTYPISEVTIAGNLTEMFMKMILANDLQFNYSTNSPSILIDNMTIAGK